MEGSWGRRTGGHRGWRRKGLAEPGAEELTRIREVRAVVFFDPIDDVADPLCRSMRVNGLYESRKRSTVGKTGSGTYPSRLPLVTTSRRFKGEDVLPFAHYQIEVRTHFHRIALTLC